jgi:uncharacterized protein (TIGR02145 family)
MSRNKIAIVILLISVFLFLQGCQDNIILPETVNHSPVPRLLYPPKGTPCKGIPTVEYSGKTYHTVEIVSQCWLRENLDVGIMIQGRDSSKDNKIIEKFCYNDSIENCNKYGGLHQWNEAMQYTTTPRARGICPPGWHIPDYFEFETLSSVVGRNGNALKAIGQGTGDGAGTNTSGFSALLAGYRTHYNSFNDLSIGAIFWSSAEFNSTYVYFASLYFTGNRISLINANYKDVGLSIRCIKD